MRQVSQKRRCDWSINPRRAREIREEEAQSHVDASAENPDTARASRPQTRLFPIDPEVVYGDRLVWEGG
jgi:hypothetical protein